MKYELIVKYKYTTTIIIIIITIKRNIIEAEECDWPLRTPPVSLWRWANARNVRLYYLYWQTPTFLYFDLYLYSAYVYKIHILPVHLASVELLTLMVGSNLCFFSIYTRNNVSHETARKNGLAWKYYPDKLGAALVRFVSNSR